MIRNQLGNGYTVSSDDYLIAGFELVEMFGHVDLDVINAHVMDHPPRILSLVRLTKLFV